MKSIIVILLFIFFTMNTLSAPSIHYELAMSNPSTHFFEVTITFDNLSRNESQLDVILPVWRPGRYVVFDFAGGVQDFDAKDEKGQSLTWGKADKTTWRIQKGKASTVAVRYLVYANEFNLRTRGLNSDHGFVDGTAVFMYVERFRKLPLTLTVHPFSNWHVTTGLEHDGNDQNKFIAPGYDYFIDCPLEIGNQKDFPFEVDGVPHVLSIAGEGNWDADTLIRDMSKIVKAEKDFWGEFPYKKYYFIVHCSPSSGGGTEHINSTVMGTRPFGFKNADSYRGFLGLVSHEFFHTWNVKQLRPKGISPYDFTKENYTEELWIAEGTTSYFDNLILVRTGFMEAQKYIDDFGTAIRNDRARPGNKVQPLAGSSFDAWVKYWKGNQQSYNSESDYYEKGANVSGLLDLTIRLKSSNKASLDDVFRKMYKKYPLTGTGYTVKDFETLCSEIAGVSMKDFFDRFVYGTDPLEWETSLASAGLEVKQKDTTAKPWTGMSYSDAGERTRITRILPGSPAEQAGLELYDEIVALNGFRARSSDVNDRIADLKIGDKITLTIFRNEQLRTVELTLGAGPLQNYKVTKVKEPTELQKSIFESWLNVKWDGK